MADSSALPQYHVIGFTGHRKVGDPERVQAQIADALEHLLKNEKVEWLAVSSTAEGSDMLFAAEVMNRGLQWEALLPLPRIDFSGIFQPRFGPRLRGCSIGRRMCGASRKRGIAKRLTSIAASKRSMRVTC
jgi:hypothetical protein